MHQCEDSWRLDTDHRFALDSYSCDYTDDEETTVSHVKRGGTKWSRDPIKNREVLDNVTKLTGILTDMSDDVTKLSVPSENIIQSENIRVDLHYRKYSNLTLPVEYLACKTRPLVVECAVSEYVNTSRGLLSTVVLYDYEVSMESPNATTISLAVGTEVEGAEVIDGLNLTVTSDQILLSGADSTEIDEFNDFSHNILNISDDDIFTYEIASHQNSYLNEEYSLGFGFTPPPPVAGNGPDSTYLIAGIGGAIALVAAIAGFVFTRGRSKPRVQGNTQFLNPNHSVEDGMDYSINPIHRGSA
tara:strand:- start:6938 stop:7840 length:903 start_codon:yes stop_codon:yes gene_type:complete